MQIYKSLAELLDMIVVFGLVGISGLMIWLLVIVFKHHKSPFPLVVRFFVFCIILTFLTQIIDISNYNREKFSSSNQVFDSRVFGHRERRLDLLLEIEIHIYKKIYKPEN